MKIVILITVLESLALTLWLIVRWYSRISQSGAHVALPRRSVAPANDDLTVKRVSAALNGARRAFTNEWQPEGQADDRIPMHGTVGNTTGSPSAHRSTARRAHQLMYKEWSRTRHE
jgi:hypothetical protein